MTPQTAIRRVDRITKLIAYIRNPACYWCSLPMQVDRRTAPDFCTVEHLIYRGNWRPRYRVLAHRWCNEQREGIAFNDWVDLLIEARTRKAFPWELQVKEETG